MAGPVLVPLCGPCTSGKKGKATITAGVANALELGRAYVNLHTAKNAAGEIRGQVKLRQEDERRRSAAADRRRRLAPVAARSGRRHRRRARHRLLIRQRLVEAA